MELERNPVVMRGRSREASPARSILIAFPFRWQPMADFALTGAMQQQTQRGGAAARGERVFRLVTQTAAFAVVIIFAGVIGSLLIGAWPALKTFGFGFLTTQVWNPVTEHFGALASMYGTRVTSALAMLVALPVGIGIAIFLTELCPRALRRPIG